MNSSFMGYNGLSFVEPEKLIIKSNMIYYNPEILYKNNIVFTDYIKSPNYALMEFWDNTEYLYQDDRYILVIDTRLFNIKKDVTEQFIYYDKLGNYHNHLNL